MKHVILLLLLSVLAFGQDITSTQQYEALINKADTELQHAQKLRDAKVRRATVLYIKALEKKKKAIMANGDLNKANELDKEIKNLKPLLVKAVVVKPKELNKETHLGYKLKTHSVGANRGSNGHYYKYISGSHSYAEAKKRAQKLGGYLATISNKVENDFIASISSTKNFWIGGEKIQGKWTWITGEKFEYYNWYIGFPKRYTHLHINRATGQLPAGKMVDISPSKNKGISGFMVEWDE